jgi:hypothetical protein
MLEFYNIIALIVIFPCLLAAVIFFLKALLSGKSIPRPLVSASLIAGAAVLTLTTSTSVVSFFKGNFLAPFTAIILGAVFASLASLIVLIMGSLAYLIPQSFQGKKNDHLSTGNLVASLIFFLLFFGNALYLHEVSHLKTKYGDIMSDTLPPMSSKEIARAYRHPIFRNHNLFIRGLLIRENVPAHIIEDIYHRIENKNVRSAIEHSSDTPCHIVEALKREKPNNLPFNQKAIERCGLGTPQLRP